MKKGKNSIVSLFLKVFWSFFVVIAISNSSIAQEQECSKIYLDDIFLDNNCEGELPSVLCCEAGVECGCGLPCEDIYTIIGSGAEDCALFLSDLDIFDPGCYCSEAPVDCSSIDYVEDCEGNCLSLQVLSSIQSDPDCNENLNCQEHSFDSEQCSTKLHIFKREDINEDEIINVLDVIASVANILGLTLEGGAQGCSGGDIDGDEVLNVLDILLMVTGLLNGSSGTACFSWSGCQLLNGDEVVWQKPPLSLSELDI